MPQPVITRIVAHTDFDGLVSAFLLQELLGVEEVFFCEPWEIQNGTVRIHPTDAVADLPYPANGCGLWFDHHASSARSFTNLAHQRFDPHAKSCPGLIYSLHRERLHKWYHLVHEADRIDSASFSEHDLRHPSSALRIAMALDTGDRERDDHYRRFVIERLRTDHLDAIAGLPITRERLALIDASMERALRPERITRHGNVVVLDLRGKPHALARTTFIQFQLSLLEAMHDAPAAVSIIVGDAEEGHARWRVSMGKNLFCPASPVDLGAVAASFGGGGHAVAAGCAIPQEDAVLSDIIMRCNG
jgi:nanoRNase/pAp phosphatase (c-di-AMP/oligoRNAs hydrolase)